MESTHLREQSHRGTEDHGTPPCFPTREEYLAWIDGARSSNIVDPAVSYCFDCTPGYQREMLKRGLCVHPETQFLIVIPPDEDGDEPFLHGLSPSAAKALNRLRRVITP